MIFSAIGMLNSQVGSVIIEDDRAARYCVVPFNDALLLGQALYGPMNRSSKRKLRERVVGKCLRIRVERETLGADFDKVRDKCETNNPLVSFVVTRRTGAKYAILDVGRMRYFEYSLYVGQRALREALYRRL